jgi:hypothetical protein
VAHHFRRRERGGNRSHHKYGQSDQSRRSAVHSAIPTLPCIILNQIDILLLSCPVYLDSIPRSHPRCFMTSAAILPPGLFVNPENRRACARNATKQRRINTYKTATKQTLLTTNEMNTYEKTGGAPERGRDRPQKTSLRRHLLQKAFRVERSIPVRYCGGSPWTTTRRSG